MYGAALCGRHGAPPACVTGCPPRGLRELTSLPGIVDTPKTAGFAKGPLWASPDKVAADIDRALQRGFGMVYTPSFWRWIMLIIKHVPERVFVRTRL